jgi:hydrogenase nickel incorporation protein HypB
MCVTCGCEDKTRTRIAAPHEHGTASSSDHPHGSGHPHDHSHRHDHATETITLEQKVLAKNDLIAQRNRAWLAGQEILAVNLMSSPGAGKTTLLERTIKDIAARRPVAVIEGDQETMFDAERVRQTGCPVVQVNTGAGCHLDAEMMQDALTTLNPPAGSLLFVENVGNLVCPALFDLGEQSRVVVISVTEGTDKPLKYPYMFATADLVVVNKIDLLPYVNFDVDLCGKYARSVNPNLQILTLSATTGEGTDSWYEWIAER